MTPLKRYRLTRYAPTPSGYLHLGNLASFVVTAGLAERFGSAILLRIDDLDRERFRREYLDDLFETLRFLGLPWHIGPCDSDDFERNFSQLIRLRDYTQLLDCLVNKNLVFACTCTRTQTGREGCSGQCRDAGIPLDKPGVAWRLTDLFRPDEQSIKLFGLNHTETTATIPPHLFPLQVRRKNALPSYHLASVSDDVRFGVDLVVRGADLYDSTLGQLVLAEALGLETFRQTAFVHHPLLTDPEGHKLSKTAGDVSVAALRREGAGRGAIYTRVLELAGLSVEVSDRRECFEVIAEKWGIK
ncbi:MAG: glutamate--tRNA ligase family protein [Cyclobacteriaceae bacterium]